MTKLFPRRCRRRHWLRSQADLMPIRNKVRRKSGRIVVYHTSRCVQCHRENSAKFEKKMRQ